MHHLRQRRTGKPGAKSDHLRTPGNSARPECSRRDVRSVVAHAAARLVAEGLTDYHSAKQKAARQLGVTDSHLLPDNHEVELALREHLCLFARESQPRALLVLRDIALRLMKCMDHFSPWLVGAVLAGTANEFSEIELELIGADAKEFERYLLNAGVEFQLSAPRSTRKRPGHLEPIKYRFEFDGAPISIALYEHHAARLAAYPRGSIKHDRADHPEAKRRFADDAGKP